VFQRYKIPFSVLPTALLLVCFIISAIHTPYSDYAGYYFGSRELLTGDYQRVYDTWSLNKLIAEQGHRNIFVSYSPFPPFTALVLSPFLWLPPATSKLMFTVFSGLLFIYTLYRSIRFFSVPGWLVLLLPVIFFIPLRNNIYFGQAYLLLTALLLEGYMAYKKGRLVLSSVLWAVAILFKLFPVLIVVFLLVRKQYRQVLYLGVAGLLLFSLSLWVNGFACWQFYVFNMMPRVNNGELNSPFTYVFQSAFMLFKNLFIYDELLNPGALHRNNPFIFVAAIALFKAFVIGGCVQATIRKKGDDLVSFGLWMLASLLISPNGSSYALILLLIPLLAVPGLIADDHPKRNFFIGWCAALLFCVNMIPIQQLVALPLLLQFPRLYLLLLFFGLLLIVTGARLNGRWLAILFVGFACLDARWLMRENDRSTPLFNREMNSLMYDFTIKGNQLVYYYWDGGGSHAVPTDYTIGKVNEQDVRIMDNQLYYLGKKISSTPDWKKKAVIADGKYIIYLSDKDRGAGFYTLRRLDLP
jgi:hypothetical protein